MRQISLHHLQHKCHIFTLGSIQLEQKRTWLKGYFAVQGERGSNKLMQGRKTPRQFHKHENIMNHLATRNPNSLSGSQRGPSTVVL